MARCPRSCRRISHIHEKGTGQSLRFSAASFGGFSSSSPPRRSPVCRHRSLRKNTLEPGQTWGNTEEVFNQLSPVLLQGKTRKYCVILFKAADKHISKNKTAATVRNLKKTEKKKSNWCYMARQNRKIGSVVLFAHKVNKSLQQPEYTAPHLTTKNLWAIHLQLDSA